MYLVCIYQWIISREFPSNGNYTISNREALAKDIFSIGHINLIFGYWSGFHGLPKLTWAYQSIFSQPKILVKSAPFNTKID
jgi:hypothetical protein